MTRPSRRTRWLPAVARAKGLHPLTRMFMTSVVGPHMKADGKISYPRERLAEESGMSPRAVSRHFQRAREAGWIVVVSRGQKGLTAEYQASFPDAAQGDTSVTLTAPVQGDTCKHPEWVTEVSPCSPVQGDTSVTPVVLRTRDSGHPRFEPPANGDFTGAHDRDVLDLEIESKSKSRNHLRAVGL